MTSLSYPFSSARPLVSTLLFIILAIALASRLYQIGQESFFFDESVTVVACGRPVMEHILEVELTPPLYFAAIKAWSGMFGTGHAALRSLSAIVGAFAAVFVALAARAMGLRRAAWVGAGLLTAVLPMGVWYGQQARAYAMLGTCVAAWLWSVIELECAPTTWRRVVLGVVMFLGFSTHYYFAFLAPAGFAYFVLRWRAAWQDAALARSAKLNLISYILACAAWLLYLPVVLGQLAHKQMAGWIPRPVWRDLYEVYAVGFLTGPFTERSRGQAAFAAIVIVAVVLLGIVVGISAWRRRGEDGASRRDVLILLFLGATTPVLIPFIISLGPISVFLTDRYTMAALPAFILIIAAGLDTVSHARRPVGAWAAGLGSAALFGMALRCDVRYWTSYQDFDWRGAIRIIDGEWREGDRMLFIPDWMLLSYQKNGGTHGEVVPDQIMLNSPPFAPRIWMANWEQAPQPHEQALAKRMKEIPGAKIRIDYGHIRMWEIETKK